MLRSSSGEVCGLLSVVTVFSLSLLLSNIQMPHEAQKGPDQAPTAESSKREEVDPLEVTLEEYQGYLAMFGSSSTEVCGFLSVITIFR